jgi:hypothetical protein
VRLELVQGELVAFREVGSDGLAARARQRDGVRVAELVTPVAFFIPEGVADPSQRHPGEQLWVEVTIPRHGAPRPIRLGVRTDGEITPIEFR